MADFGKVVLNMNEWNQTRISKIIVQKLFGTISGKKLAILGFSFKANTNDTRESSAIKICKNLIDEGAILSIYDPKVEEKQIEIDLSAKSNNKGTISSWKMVNSIYEAAKDADACILLTEWEEFKQIDWERFQKK